MLNKNQFIGMPIPGQYQFIPYSNNNSPIDNFLMENINDKFNNLNEQKFNIVFKEEGNITNIVCNFNITVEDVLKNYAKRVGIKMDDIFIIIRYHFIMMILKLILLIKLKLEIFFLNLRIKMF